MAAVASVCVGSSSGSAHDNKPKRDFGTTSISACIHVCICHVRDISSRQLDFGSRPRPGESLGRYLAVAGQRSRRAGGVHRRRGIVVFAMRPLDRDEWILALGTAYAAGKRKRSDWLLAGAENWGSLFGFRTLWCGDRNPSATIRRMNPSEGHWLYLFRPPVSWPLARFFFVLLFVLQVSLLFVPLAPVCDKFCFYCFLIRV